MKLLKAFMLLILGASLTHAQDQQNYINTEISIHLLASDRKLSKLQWVVREKQTEIYTSSSAILPPTKYQGPKVLKLYKGGVTVTEETVPLIKVALPEARRILLAVVKEGEKYKAYPFNAEVTKMPIGSRYMVNFSSYQISGIMGRDPFDPKKASNKKFVVNPKSAKVVEAVAGAKQNEALQVYASYRPTANDKWKPFITKKWFNTTTKRKYVFFFDFGAKKLPRYKTVSEVVVLPPVVE